MYKMAWKDQNETKRDKSKTTKFLRLLVRIFLIPLTIDPTKNEIRFMFWSKPTMFHIILYWIPFYGIEIYTFYAGKVSGLTDHIASNSSTIEQYSKWLQYIIQLAMFFPLMLCHQIGKKKLSADLFLGYAHCPGRTWCNFLSIFLMFFGSLAHMLYYMDTFDMEHDMYMALLVSWIIVLFILAVFWSLSAFIVEILMENLFVGKGKNNFVFSSTTTIEKYIKLSESFGTFFLIFFSVNQISAIVNYFLCVSKLSNYVSVAFCLIHLSIYFIAFKETMVLIDVIGILSSSGISKHPVLP